MVLNQYPSSMLRQVLDFLPSVVSHCFGLAQFMVSSPSCNSGEVLFIQCVYPLQAHKPLKESQDNHYGARESRVIAFLCLSLLNLK
jgi:hypothetical protein